MTESSPPLVGRDRELEKLAKLLEKSERGSLGIALIHGEAGVGKTRLLREAVHGWGHETHVGQGHEMGRDRPFGIFLDFLGVADASELVDEVEPYRPDYAELRYMTIERIVDLIAGWSKTHPVLIGLDDLQWADPSSLLALDQIAQRLSAQPIAVIATVRPNPRNPALEQLIRSLTREDTAHIRLGPLDDAEVNTLTTSLLGGSPGPGLQSLLEQAAGNPFFVTEVIAALEDEGRIAVGEGVADTETTAELPSLQTTVLGRLGYLPSRTLDILRVAAVIGSRFTFDDLSVVLATPATDLLTELEEPMTAGVIVGSGKALEFRHHLVWDALYHELPLAVREAIHIQVARRLAEAGRPADMVGTHFLAGASPGDRQAVEWLESAADEAVSSAPDVAVQLLEGALDLVGDADEKVGPLSVRLATALTWAGRMDEAEELLEGLVESGLNSGDDAEMRLALARVQIIQGKPFAARANYDLVSESETLVGRPLARALADKAVACLMSGDVVTAGSTAHEAIELAKRHADDVALCGGLSAASWVANLGGRTSEAVDLGDQAVALAELSESRETARRYPHVFQGVVLVDADDLERARRLFDVGRRTAEAFGDTWQLPIHHLGAALVDFYAGKLDDATTALATADELVAEVGTKVLFVWSSSLAAHIAIERDELERAKLLLDAAEDHVATSGPGMGYDWLLWGRARLLEAEDDVPAARAVLDNAWALSESLGIVSQRRLIGPDYVRLLTLTGESEKAGAAAEAMAANATLSGIASIRAAALRCDALATGNQRSARESVDIARECPQLVELARTCEDAAFVFETAGEEAEAKELLGEAADIYRDSGARRGERRVEAGLRRLGVSRGSKRPRKRPSTGWEALTPTEVEVTALAADGMTNPEIGRRLYVSPRTIETHLSHVYAKLGISSRVELAGLVASRDDG